MKLTTAAMVAGLCGRGTVLDALGTSLVLSLHYHLFFLHWKINCNVRKTRSILTKASCPTWALITKVPAVTQVPSLKCH